MLVCVKTSFSACVFPCLSLLSGRLVLCHFPPSSTSAIFAFASARLCYMCSVRTLCSHTATRVPRKQVYYDAYYSVYLEHYMSLMSGATPESEGACDVDEDGGVRAEDWHDESDESISGYSAASGRSGDVRAGTGLRNRRR